jgi:dTDP-4-dehydrorhamnose 3,5-epimerase
MSSTEVNINDVIVRDLTVHGDARGRVFEGWRDEWTPFTVKQLTEARAQAGVLKGLHLHYIQWDWWRVVTGRMLVGLYDARPHSSTFKNSATFEMSADAPKALAIPPGVAHGFHALEDLEMIYLLSEVYNPADEHGVKWDSVGIDWPLVGEPIISERDLNLPTAEEFDFAPPAGAPAGAGAA